MQEEQNDYNSSCEMIENLVQEATKEIENIFYYLGCDMMVKKDENQENLFQISKIN